MIGSYLGDLLSSAVQRGGGGGDAGRQEVKLGDGEVLLRSVELGDSRMSLEVDEEAGRVESMSIIGDTRVGEEEKRKTFSINLT